MIARNMFSSFIIMAFFLISGSLFYADAGDVEKSVSEYKKVSQELIKQYMGDINEEGTETPARQIAEATERQKKVIEALNMTIKDMNPDSEEDGKIIENAYTEIQAANKAVSEAQLKSWETRSVATFQKAEGDLKQRQTAMQTQSVGASKHANRSYRLSSDDLKKVMAWIALEVSNDRQPYCYRRSYGRGVGKPMKCAAGLEQDAGLCYNPCKRGYKGVGPVCWQSCPKGFRDDGAFCAKPRPYGRGVGYPWKFGDGLNDRGMRKRCERDNPQGCEKSGLIYYPKCKPGYHAFGCCICTPNCQLGQTDIGVSCAKKSYGRGVGKPLSTCGNDQDKDAWLCYPKCRSGFHGVGPVCWQDCPPGRTNCGVGCASEKKECVSGTVSMVIAPLVLAVNIATMGSSSPATSAAATSRISELMKQLAESTKDIRELYKLVKQVGTVAFETDKTMQMWVTDYIGDFESMTTKRVVTELSKHFNGPTLYWVKQQYAMNHLTLILKSDGIQTAQNVLSAISTFDPTGVTGVVSAFANPMCASDQNFPPVKLRPIY